MVRMIRVDVNNGNVREEPVAEDRLWMAGRALTSRLLQEEVDPGCDVFGASNKLIISAGLLAGTTVSSANRLSVGGKSPLTETIKESNAGGNVAYKMGRMGIRGIILEGLPADDQLKIIHVSQAGTTIQAADEYREMTTYQAAEKLKEKFGPKVGLVLIGPAGEHKSLAAALAVTDHEGRPSRFAGRGGLGALMGSKGIKALVVDDQGAKGPAIADEDKFKTLRTAVAQEILNNEQVANSYTKFGTAGIVTMTNGMGALPTRNFSRGSFEEVEAISGQRMYDVITSRGGEGNPSHACMPGCVIRCSNVYPDEDGKELVSPVEYETIGLMGSNCGIGDLDIIAKLNYQCNDLGLDTIDMGGAIAIAMEAGVIEFGDGKGALGLMDEIRRDTWLGRILASGGQRTGEVLGVRRIPSSKRQIMAAYDPRAIKGMGVTYATSTMGADHTTGTTLRSPVEHTKPEGQVEASREARWINTLHDCVGTCFFLGGAINKKFEWLAQLVTAVYGKPCELDDLMQIVKDTLRSERDFNRRAGFNEADDRLPEFFYTEENPDAKTVFDISQEDMQRVHEEL